MSRNMFSALENAWDQSPRRRCSRSPCSRFRDHPGCSGSTRRFSRHRPPPRHHPPDNIRLIRRTSVASTCCRLQRFHQGSRTCTNRRLAPPPISTASASPAELVQRGAESPAESATRRLMSLHHRRLCPPIRSKSPIGRRATSSTACNRCIRRSPARRASRARSNCGRSSARRGSIENLIVVRGHPMLATAAIEAVRRWRYRPYLLNNEPIEVETEITVNFVLSGG